MGRSVPVKAKPPRPETKLERAEHAAEALKARLAAAGIPVVTVGFDAEGLRVVLRTQGREKEVPRRWNRLRVGVVYPEPRSPKL